MSRQGTDTPSVPPADTLDPESPALATATPDPPSETASDPARAWGGVPFASRASSPSVAGSARSRASSRNSVNSAVRRARAEQKFDTQYADEYEDFMNSAFQEFARAQEAKHSAMEDALKQEDLASEARSRAMDPPDASAVDAEPEVLKRRMDDLRDQYARYERLFRAKTGSPAPPLSRAPPGRTQADSPALLARSVSRPALPTVKIKVDKPKAWDGKFEWAARETWIRTATLYLASIGVRLDDVLDETETPEAFYIVRGFFSTEASSDGVSPQRWFDALNDRSPFPSPRAVFAAIKAHWADDAAAETALEKYRAAKQGNLKARDFGAKVDSLANACMDRVVDELDRKTTFLGGLNSDVKDFTKVELARRGVSSGAGLVSYADLVKIAAITDTLSSFSRKSATSSSSAPSGKKSTGTDSPSSKAPAASSSSSTPKPPAGWVDAAVEFQRENPLATKSEWHRPSSNPTPGKMWCYNCATYDRHYSRACTKPCRDPKTVVIAAITTARPAASSSSPPDQSQSEEASTSSSSGKD
ncbi:hypothetical protein JCM10450v2_001788 [Rhodotorula kratochvilovae]